MDKREYLNTFQLLINGMIKKDKQILMDSMTIDANLYHITGKCETRDEYIEDILNGTLNYYDCEIVKFNESEAVVKLLAKVYGSARSWWGLAMRLNYAFEDGKLKVKECRVALA